MKKIIFLFSLFFNFICFSQIKKNIYERQMMGILSENSLIFKSSYKINNFKGNRFQVNTLHSAKSGPVGCMWCFLAPVAAGVLYYQSYISFKEKDKTGGYVALGLATGFTVFSVIYFFPKKNKKDISDLQFQ